MATSGRRTSAFSTDAEFSLSQSDEIRTKSALISKESGEQSTCSIRLSKDKKRWTIWMIYFIGFMVSFYTR